MHELFFGYGVAHTILLLAFVIGIGLYLGRFKAYPLISKISNYHFSTSRSSIIPQFKETGEETGDGSLSPF